MLYVGLDVHDQRIAICALVEAWTRVAPRDSSLCIATPPCGMGATT
jgi:hypothetical protein